MGPKLVGSGVCGVTSWLILQAGSQRQLAREMSVHGPSTFSLRFPLSQMLLGRSRTRASVCATASTAPGEGKLGGGAFSVGLRPLQPRPSQSGEENHDQVPAELAHAAPCLQATAEDA